MTAGEEFLAALGVHDESTEPAFHAAHGRGREPSERERQLQELLDDLAGRRVTAAAESDRVGATVDGTGRIIDIRIDDAAVRQPHPQLLGAQVLQAIVAARRSAAELEQQLLGELRQDRGPGS